jgi:hypothetical protein
MVESSAGGRFRLKILARIGKKVLDKELSVIYQ